MELFTVTCTTCQQRLKVCDESAIGEIQICPKCGSMVLIHPPSDSPTGADEAPPTASSESATPVSLPPPVADANVGSFDTESPAPEDGDAGGPDAEAATPPAVAEPHRVTEPPRQHVVVPPAKSPPKLPPHIDQGQLADVEQDREAVADDRLSPANNGDLKPPRNRQQWLLVGGGAIAGVALALGVFGFVASRAYRSRPSGDPVSPQNVAVIEAVAEETDPRTEAQTPVDHTDDLAAEDATADSPAVTPAPDEAAPDEAATGEAPEPHANTPPAIGVEHGETVTPPAVIVVDDASEGTHDGPAEAPPLPGPIDPSLPPTPQMEPSSASLAETLDTFAPFIDPEAFVPTPGAPPPVQENPPELGPDESGDDALDVPRPEPREVDVAQRLADEIPAIEFRDIPLKAFVRFLMGFSTIPITLDPDALSLVGVTSDTRINVQQANTTVGRALAEALVPLRLGIEVSGDQILVTRASSPDAPLRTYSHPAGDLVAGDPARLDELAGLIMEMVEPNSWDALGGAGAIRPKMPSLVIRQCDTGLFRAIVFCERLRTARGLAPQSNFDPALFELEPRFTRVAEVLRRPVTLNYIEPTSFVQIVDQLSDESGLQILIDWRELAALGWNPEAETTISASADAVGEVLSGVLRPMGLTCRVLGPTSLQVTSPEKLASHLDIEFFPVDALLSSDLTSDKLLARIRAELGEQALDEVGATFGFDPPSGFLIAALPQPLQRKLFALLEQWRAAGMSPEG